jgi:hypothetical protein
MQYTLTTSRANSRRSRLRCSVYARDHPPPSPRSFNSRLSDVRLAFRRSVSASARPPLRSPAFKQHRGTFSYCNRAAIGLACAQATARIDIAPHKRPRRKPPQPVPDPHFFHLPPHDNLRDDCTRHLRNSIRTYIWHEMVGEIVSAPWVSRVLLGFGHLPFYE